MNRIQRISAMLVLAAAVLVVSLTYSIRAFADLARMARQPFNGPSLTLVLQPEPQNSRGTVHPADIQQAKRVLSSRLQGVLSGRPFQLTVEGDRFLVALPPSENMGYITSVLTSRGEVEFISGGELPPVGVSISPEMAAQYPVLFTGQDILQAQPPNSAGGQIFFRLGLAPDTARRLAEFTATQTGRYLCMALDGQVLTCSRMYQMDGDTLEILPELSSGAILSLTDVGIFIDSGPLPWPLTATAP